MKKTIRKPVSLGAKYTKEFFNLLKYVCLSFIAPNNFYSFPLNI